LKTIGAKTVLGEREDHREGETTTGLECGV